jgi:hypothetical protein
MPKCQKIVKWVLVNSLQLSFRQQLLYIFVQKSIFESKCCTNLYTAAQRLKVCILVFSGERVASFFASKREKSRSTPRQ